jgi:spore germination cell wall hydrolase CwlJ-like protein
MIFAFFLAMVTPGVSYANEQILCLQETIYFEARGESQEGQIAVAHVVLNRLLSEKFPDEICDVVYQRHQFSWTSNKPKIGNKKAWEQAKRLAVIALKWYAVGEDFSKGARYFHSGKAPYWAKHFKHKLTIDGHHFYG